MFLSYCEHYFTCGIVVRMGKTQEYIDTHTHINLPAFQDDYEGVIQKTLHEGVWMINVGTQYKTSDFAVRLAEEYDGVFATVGLHPLHTAPSDTGEEGEVFTRSVYEVLAKSEKVVAVGECGLDYYRDISDADWKKQIEAFEQQIYFANAIKKPLMLHLRNGSRGNAYRDAFAIIKEKAQTFGNAHFFAGTLEDAKLFWNSGFSTSFTGVVTFTNQYDGLVREAPSELIHAETDAPYVAPVPHRGKRNEPHHVREVVAKIAEIRGVSVEAMQETLACNAKKLYGV